jgi:hypothetical protein
MWNTLTDTIYKVISTYKSGLNGQVGYKLEGLNKRFFFRTELLVEWTNYLILELNCFCEYIEYSNMNWFNQDILYSIPDEIGSFADCSLNSSVIQCLNKHYSNDNLKRIPNTLTTLTTTYTNELFGCRNKLKRTIEN